MLRFTVLCLILCLFCFSNKSFSQSNQYYIKIDFNEWMDTTGFTDPDNFTWSGGLVTISSNLIDTSTALLVISQPDSNQWYTLQVYNVYDRAGNLIDSDCDTSGFILKPFPLPVELSSFEAHTKGQLVKLTWSTETEVNNYGFDIERTSPAPSPYQGEGGEAGRGWVKIGFVEGSGNSNSPKLYSFNDNNLIGGSKFIYRLKQIDTDGTFEYSDEVEVEIMPFKFTLFQNYPNPFNPITTIRYQLPEDCLVKIIIYDITGSEITTILNETKPAGTFEKEFNAAVSHSGSVRNLPAGRKGLASGVYLYRIIAESLTQKQRQKFIETKKMILLR